MQLAIFIFSVLFAAAAIIPTLWLIDAQVLGSRKFQSLAGAYVFGLTMIPTTVRLVHADAYLWVPSILIVLSAVLLRSRLLRHKRTL